MLAWGRTNPASDFRQDVARRQQLMRPFPISLLHFLVPFGNQVVNGTTPMTERSPTIHTSSRLLPRHTIRPLYDHLAIVLKPLLHGPVFGFPDSNLHESLGIDHMALTSLLMGNTLKFELPILPELLEDSSVFGGYDFDKPHSLLIEEIQHLAG